MKNKADRYSPESIINYHLALAVMNSMEKSGRLAPERKRKLYTILTRKYGYDSGSIFAA